MTPEVRIRTVIHAGPLCSRSPAKRDHTMTTSVHASPAGTTGQRPAQRRLAEGRFVLGLVLFGCLRDSSVACGLAGTPVAQETAVRPEAQAGLSPDATERWGMTWNAKRAADCRTLGAADAIDRCMNEGRVTGDDDQRRGRPLHPRLLVPRVTS
jgi:hypothetical protein